MKNLYNSFKLFVYILLVSNFIIGPANSSEALKEASPIDANTETASYSAPPIKRQRGNSYQPDLKTSSLPRLTARTSLPARNSNFSCSVHKRTRKETEEGIISSSDALSRLGVFPLSEGVDDMRESGSPYPSVKHISSELEIEALVDASPISESRSLLLYDRTLNVYNVKDLLMDLPGEVQQYLLTFLSPPDLAAMARCSRLWYSQTQDDYIWHQIAKSYKIAVRSGCQTWREVCQRFALLPKSFKGLKAMLLQEEIQEMLGVSPGGALILSYVEQLNDFTPPLGHELYLKLRKLILLPHKSLRKLKSFLAIKFCESSTILSLEAVRNWLQGCSIYSLHWKNEDLIRAAYYLNPSFNEETYKRLVPFSKDERELKRFQYFRNFLTFIHNFLHTYLEENRNLMPPYIQWLEQGFTKLEGSFSNTENNSLLEQENIMRSTRLLLKIKGSDAATIIFHTFIPRKPRLSITSAHFKEGYLLPSHFVATITNAGLELNAPFDDLILKAYEQKLPILISHEGTLPIAIQDDDPLIPHIKCYQLINNYIEDYKAAHPENENLDETVVD
ncbi:F-box-like domain-containing protein [Candidatus Odyssella thessalonicensis]|uniref:F-box-like domain-containing protein n=1 Tax=Candidatus Odyssella thessalonicensis TaxID=84647 RepID=UPI000225B74C|nr:F-box protein [Candidatus Odyssella thessalonicensis]